MKFSVIHQLRVLMLLHQVVARYLQEGTVHQGEKALNRQLEVILWRNLSCLKIIMSGKITTIEKKKLLINEIGIFWRSHLKASTVHRTQALSILISI